MDGGMDGGAGQCGGAGLRGPEGQKRGKNGGPRRKLDVRTGLWNLPPNSLHKEKEKPGSQRGNPDQNKK